MEYHKLPYLSTIAFVISIPLYPIAPYNNNPQIAVESQFVDYNSGDVLQGRHYWKPLSDVFLDYIDHPESKFVGDAGVLKRRRLKPEGCVYIGKEDNKVEMQELENNRIETYYNRDRLKEFVLNLTLERVRDMGIEYRSSLNYVKKKAKEVKLNLNSPVMRRILKHY